MATAPIVPVSSISLSPSVSEYAESVTLNVCSPTKQSPPQTSMLSIAILDETSLAER